jgi:uncharacterized protein YukE
MADIASSRIQVGAELEGAGSYVNGVASAVGEELSTLRQQLSPLIDAWTKSQAASMYQDDMNLWNTAAEALFGASWDVASPGGQNPYEEGQGVLGAIAAMLDVNNSNYVDAEAANVKTWQTS